MAPRTTGAGAIRVVARVDAERASEDFKIARRDLDRRLKDGLQQAGEKVVLPDAKRRARNLAVTSPSGVKTTTAGSLIVKPRARDAVLTTNMRGKLARAVGLQEFGGTVHTPIRPKKKKALVVNGQPVSVVDTPRVYKARHFLTGAVEAKRDQIGQAILDESMKAFDGFETS